MKRNLFITYAVLFGAYIGISLPLPLLGPLILSDSSPFLISAEYRHVYLSLMLAAFPLGHLAGAPLMGSLSDRFGRKRVLLIGLSGGAIFYAFSGLAIYKGNIFLLMFSRTLSGLFEGNAAIAQSYLASISDENNKAKRFGAMGAVMSLGYIMGPVMGGMFQSSRAFAFSSSVLPFWVVGLFLFFTMIFVAFFLNTDKKTNTVKIKISPALSQIFASSDFTRLMILALMLAISRSLYIDFLASFLKLRFDLDTKDTIWLWIFIAATWGIAALVSGFKIRFISSQNKVILASALAGLTLILAAFVQGFIIFSVLGLIIVVGLSITVTLIGVFVSNIAPSQYAGLAMGLLGSTMLFGELIACCSGGYLLSLHLNAPFIIAGLISIVLCSGLMHFFWRPIGARQILG